jgi:hypothetical protein
MDTFCEETKSMLTKSREIAANEESHNIPEYKELCREVRKKMKTYIRNYNTERVKKRVEI